MKILLLTLLVTFMVFLNSVESYPPKLEGSPVPDPHHPPQNPNRQFEIVVNPDNRLEGIQYGEELIRPIPNNDGTIWGFEYKGKEYERVKYGNGAELFDVDHNKVGTYDGAKFYNKPQGEPGRAIVEPKDGYYLKVGGKRIATFQDFFRYDRVRKPQGRRRYDYHYYLPEGPSKGGPSGGGSSRGGSSRSGSSSGQNWKK